MPRISGVNKSGYEIGAMVELAVQLGSAPPGLLLCHGAAVDIALYPLLFAKIGYTWGNPGGGQFRLPDLRGRIARGRANGSARDPYRANRGSGGSDTHPYSQSLPGQATGDAVGSPQGETTRRSQLSAMGITASGNVTSHNHGGGTHYHYTKWSSFPGGDSGGGSHAGIVASGVISGAPVTSGGAAETVVDSQSPTFSGSGSVASGGDSANSMPNVYVDFYIAYI